MQLWYIPDRRESFTSRSAEVIYVTQQCRCLSMLIFRAWATCGVVSTKCKSSYWVVMVCDHTSLSCKGNLDGTTALSCLILSAALFLWGKLGSVNLENNSWCNNVQESLKVNSWVSLLQSGKFFHYCLIIFGVEVTKLAAMILNSLSFDHINWKTSRRRLTENSAAETKILLIEFLT